MFAPNIVTHIKYKPLIPKGELERFDSQKVLKSLRREVLKEIKKKILQEPFSQAAKKALLDGFRITTGARSITIEATDPRFRYLLEGRRNRQMTWLTKARVPIPIITDSGDVIFRSASPRSMKNGSWYHPGKAPSKVIDKAREAAREVIKRRLRAQLKKHLRQVLQRHG